MISKGYFYVINLGIGSLVILVINLGIGIYISIDISVNPVYPASVAKDLS